LPSRLAPLAGFCCDDTGRQRGRERLRMTTAAPIGTARTLTDLDKARFRIVAVRGRIDKERDGWAYTVPDREIASLKNAISDGTLIAVTARTDDKLRLLAKVSASVRA